MYLLLLSHEGSLLGGAQQSFSFACKLASSLYLAVTFPPAAFTTWYHFCIIHAEKQLR